MSEPAPTITITLTREEWDSIRILVDEAAEGSSRADIREHYRDLETKIGEHMQ